MGCGRWRWLVLSAVVALLPGARAGAGEAAPPCGGRVGEKLGIHFVEVCGPGAGDPPFWISAAPMPCSAGEHETIACPSITPLLASGTGARPAALATRRAAMVDRLSAHRMCALRFAGRVATRAEIERALAARGLAAVVVSEATAGDGEFRFDALPEWTQDGACENPSVLGGHCRLARWPDAGTRPAPMSAVRACDARRVRAGEGPLQSVPIGGRCPARNWSWNTVAGTAEQELPCGVSLAGGDVRFALACRAPAATPPPAPPEGGDIAGFRCVLPTWALATFQPVVPD